MKAKSSLFLIGSLAALAFLIKKAARPKGMSPEPDGNTPAEGDPVTDGKYIDLTGKQADLVITDIQELTIEPRKAIGKLSDPQLDLANVLRGIERGWYKARPDILNGMYVVYLSGKRTDGTTEQDVFPISKETYDALVAQGVGACKSIGKSYTLTPDEREALKWMVGHFVGDYGDPDIEDEIADLQTYRALISDEEFERFKSLLDFLDDDYTYPRVNRKMLADDRDILIPFLEWVDENDFGERIFGRGSGIGWDFLSASEKVREL